MKDKADFEVMKWFFLALHVMVLLNRANGEGARGKIYPRTKGKMVIIAPAN